MAEADKVALEADKVALTAQVTTFALLALKPAMTLTRRKAKSPLHVPNRCNRRLRLRNRRLFINNQRFVNCFAG